MQPRTLNFCLAIAFIIAIIAYLNVSADRDELQRRCDRTQHELEDTTLWYRQAQAQLDVANDSISDCTEKLNAANAAMGKAIDVMRENERVVRRFTSEIGDTCCGITTK